MIPTWIHCSLCGRDFQTSLEDPDATFSDALEHLTLRHPGADPLVIKEGPS